MEEFTYLAKLTVTRGEEVEFEKTFCNPVSKGEYISHEGRLYRVSRITHYATYSKIEAY